MLSREVSVGRYCCRRRGQGYRQSDSSGSRCAEEVDFRADTVQGSISGWLGQSFNKVAKN